MKPNLYFQHRHVSELCPHHLFYISFNRQLKGNTSANRALSTFPLVFPALIEVTHLFLWHWVGKAFLTPWFLWHPWFSPSANPVHPSLRTYPGSMFPMSNCHPEPKTPWTWLPTDFQGIYLFPFNVLSVCFYWSRQGDTTKLKLDHSAQVPPRQKLNSVCWPCLYL